MSRPIVSGREVVLHPLEPGERCEWCGDMLSEEECVGMRERMKEPEERARLIEELAESTPEAIRVDPEIWSKK